MKNLYIKILEILNREEVKQEFRDNGLVPPQYIDIDRGQYNNPERFDLILYPAVFYKWSVLNENNSLKKLGELNITISVIYEDILRTSNIDNIKDESFKFFDFIDILIKYLRGIETENTGKLQLVSEGVQTQDEGDISVYQIQFKCSFTDYRFCENKQYVKIENINFEN